MAVRIPPAPRRETSARAALVDAIRDYNAGREPERLEIKYREMRTNAFAFFRGACHLFYQRLARDERLQRAPAAWICGDLHLENFGCYKGDNRLVYFDLNDFDEACLAPATLELVRFGTSLLLAADEMQIGESAAEGLAADSLQAYVDALHDGKARWVERSTATGLVGKLLKTVRNRTRRDLLDAATHGRKRGRQFTIDGKHRLRASAADRTAVIKALRAFAASDRRPAHYPPEFFEVLDVARRIAGTGSLGQRRFVALVEGRGARDGHFLLDIKESLPSAVVPYVRLAQPSWASDAVRISTIQRRAEAIAPALLTWLEMGGRPYVLKELQPVTDRLTLTSKTSESALAGALGTMARTVAWSHLRSGGRQGSATADEWIAFAADSSWRRYLLTTVRRARLQTMRDWSLFAAAYDAGDFART